MSLNVRIDVAIDGVHAWPNRYKNILAYIFMQKPDIVMMQEVAPQMLEDLLPLQEQYDVYALGRNADGTGEACPIYYLKSTFEKIDTQTIWLSDTPMIKGSMDLEEGFPRIASKITLMTHQKQKFQVINTHFAYRSKRNQAVNKTVLFGEFVKDEKMPLIVGGDFNLQRTALQDAIPPYLDWLGKHDQSKTFHGFSGGEGTTQIDHILVNCFKELDFLIDQSPFHDAHLSDHYPVLFKVEYI